MTDLAECKGCRILGRCCWTAVTVGKHASGRAMRIYSRVPCPYLDTKTGLCDDYDHRQEHEWCIAHWDQVKDAGSDKNNTPHWCPNNDTKGALMLDATHFFRLSGGKPADLRTFLERIDKSAINQMEHEYGLRGWEVDLRVRPTKPATEPLADYKKTQEIKRLIRRRT